MSTASAQLNFFNRAATSSTRLTGLPVDLQKILHRAIFTQSIAVGPNGRSSLFNPELQNFYNLLTQALHFSRLQTSCWPSRMNARPPKGFIYIDIA